jgi:hypothetical protein
MRGRMFQVSFVIERRIDQIEDRKSDKIDIIENQ